MNRTPATARRLAPGLAALIAAACSEDNKLQLVPCVDPGELSGIEHVSALEDSEALPSGSDAVVLDMTGAVPEDGGWRVASVDVLVVIPESEFAGYPATTALGVDLWDADAPTTGAPLRVQQLLDPATIDWGTATIPLKQPDGSRAQVPVRQGWWPFDFSKLVPPGGMTSPNKRYVVAVRWPSGARPRVGMSHFDRACARNWTDRGDGAGWKQNSTNEDSNFCSWPMFRVHTEILTQRLTCEPSDGGE